MARVAYLGAWNHIQVARDLFSKGIKEFICIDTQPRNEFDIQEFEPIMYRKDFVAELLETCAEYNFYLQSTQTLDHSYEKTVGVKRSFWDKLFRRYSYINPTLFRFHNPRTGQDMRYYISTNILYNMCPQLEEDLRGCKGLVISGYFPHKRVLDYLPKNVEFYCYTDTIYRIDEDTKDKVVEVMNKMEEIVIYKMHKNSGQLLSTHSSYSDLLE